ncbi:hypothetical protein B0J14DRAFT_610622 [Halenospora varia]|nr:hypothetical protein B0J14DRAFT_610622 [Halenospora varia]
MIWWILNRRRVISSSLLYAPLEGFKDLSILLIKLEEQSQNATTDGLELNTKGPETAGIVKPQFPAFSIVQCDDSGNVRYNLTLDQLG